MGLTRLREFYHINNTHINALTALYNNNIILMLCIAYCTNMVQYMCKDEMGQYIEWNVVKSYYC